SLRLVASCARRMPMCASALAVFFFKAPPTTEIYTLSLHDALPICQRRAASAHKATPIPANLLALVLSPNRVKAAMSGISRERRRSEEHTSELQSRENLVCRLLLEKKKKTKNRTNAQSTQRTTASNP